MRSVSKTPRAPSTVCPKAARPQRQQPIQTPQPLLRMTATTSRRPPPHTRRPSTQRTPIQQPTSSSSSQGERPSSHPTGQRPASGPPPLTQTETRRPLPPSSAHRGATRPPPHWPLLAAATLGLWPAASCWCWGPSMAWCACGGGHTHTAHTATGRCLLPVCLVAMAEGASSTDRMATIWYPRHSPTKAMTGDKMKDGVRVSVM
mmetsp:Transcript_23140/g.66296  ORF Transcript_23140/g.66296 Transcript_23140/m.66296 type:complete len:204 (-) Transcript_23140:471-1082(-)